MIDQTAPIIVIRKNVAHAAHHGGAWKVAYADFVTAMMALFIVLWLMNSSEQVKKAVSVYFQDPSGAGHLAGTASAGSGESLAITHDDMPKLKDKLQQAIKQIPELAALKDYVQMTVTGEGLRIELIEGDHPIFFDSGNSKPSGVGQEMIEHLAQELGKLPNDLLVEGHTDSRPFLNPKSHGREDYSNWELSADRANAARRLMEASGLRPQQVVQVRGFADQSPRVKDHPEDPSNRRISVIVRYRSAPPPVAAKEGSEKETSEKGASEKAAPQKETPKKGSPKNE
jgi:chemotaxis protein MotB